MTFALSRASTLISDADGALTNVSILAGRAAPAEMPRGRWRW